MYVLLGVTAGDDLIPSWKVALGASEEKAAVDARKKWHEAELVKNAKTVANASYMEACAVYARFEIVECPTLVADSAPTSQEG